MEFSYTPAVNAAKENDEGAFNFLYYKSYPILKREALKYVANENDADDILQDTYISIFKNIGTLKDPERFISWALTICRNYCINECKRRNRINSRTEFQKESSEEEDDRIDTLAASAYDLSINPEAAMDAGETKRLLDEIIGDLPPMQRTCIMLWQEEFSIKEISEKVMIPEGTVKSNVNYAKKKIKERVLHLEKQGTKLYGLAPIPFFLWLLNQYETVYFPKNIAEGAVGSYTAVAKGLHAGISGSAATQGAPAAKGIASHATAAGSAKSVASEVSKAAVSGGLKKAGMSAIIKVTIGVSAAAMAVGTVAGAKIISNRSPRVEIQEQEDNASSISDVIEDLSQPDTEGEDDLSGAVTTSNVAQAEVVKTPEEQYNDLLHTYVDFLAGKVPYNETDIPGFVGESDDRLVDVSEEDTVVYAYGEAGICLEHCIDINENTKLINTDADGYFILNGSRCNYFEESPDAICYAICDIDMDGKNECLFAKRWKNPSFFLDNYYYDLIELWTTDAAGHMQKVRIDPDMLILTIPFRQGEEQSQITADNGLILQPPEHGEEQSEVNVCHRLTVSPEGCIYSEITHPNGKSGWIRTYQISTDNTLEMKLDVEFFLDKVNKEIGYRIGEDVVSREAVFGEGAIVWNTLRSFAGYETTESSPE